MKDLPKKFKKFGDTFIQEEKGKNAVKYRRESPYDGEPNWEVFLRKTTKARTIKGKQIEEYEKYPGNEDFGKWAWYFINEQNAMVCFNVLESGQSWPAFREKNKKSIMKLSAFERELKKFEESKRNEKWKKL